MKIINKPNMSFQSALTTLQQWINDVRTTDDVIRQDDENIFTGTISVFFENTHPFGDFDISFYSGITEYSYLTTSGAVTSLLYADKNAQRSDETDPTFEKDAQLIQVSMEAGYALPKKDPDCPQGVFVSSKLCEVSYLFNQNKIAKSLKINGIEYESAAEIYPNLICPAVSTFLTFLTNFIEGSQEYRWLRYQRSYTDVWMKKARIVSVESPSTQVD